MPTILQPTFPVEIETGKQVLVSQTSSGARRAVRKSKAFRFYTMEHKAQQRSEYETLEPIWSANYPGQTFEWVSATLNASGQFYFDSALKWSPARTNLIDYSYVLKRRDAQVVVAPESNALPFAPNYGYDVEPQKQVSASDSVDFSRHAAALSSMRRLFALVFRNRSLAELLEMEQFWDYHYPCKQVSFTDPVIDTGGVLEADGDFWIDSNFKWRVVARNLVDYSFALREV